MPSRFVTPAVIPPDLVPASAPAAPEVPFAPSTSLGDDGVGGPPEAADVREWDEARTDDAGGEPEEAWPEEESLASVSPDDPAWAAAPVDADPIEAPAQATDWLDRICPYLVSEDGTSRSSQPDERHRCTAQDPPATLPLAFQERFCLTERHVRCEMYKVAEDARSAAFAEDSIPPEQVKSARFRPLVRSRPVALEPSVAVVADPPAPAGPDRQILVALAGAGAFALVLLVIAVVLGSGGSGGSGLPAGAVTPPPGRPVATAAPARTAAPVTSPGGDDLGTDAPSDAHGPILIRYEVQPNERLLKISETFGTTIRAIVRANPDFGESGNARDARAGDVLIVPVSPDMTEEAIMDVPGFLEFVESEE